VQHTQPTVTAQQILEIAGKFAESKSVMTAVEIGLFTHLHDTAETAREISEKLSLHERAAVDYLHLLLRLGLLEKNGERFSNSGAADRFLVETSPDYIGDSIEYFSSALYPGWGQLAERIRTGPGYGDDSAADNHARQFYQNLVNDEVGLSKFLDGLDAYNSIPPSALAEILDWNLYKTVADVGGARGRHISYIVTRHQHLTAKIVDLPPLEPFALKLMTSLGLADRVHFHAADFFADELPGADAIILGDVLHNWSIPVRQMLAAKAFSAIRAGGALLVYDRMMDDNREDIGNLIASLNLFIATRGGGSEYTISECRDYMSRAGFSEISANPVGDTGHCLVIGHKAGYAT
jgi:hypothetical protein